MSPYLYGEVSADARLCRMWVLADTGCEAYGKPGCAVAMCCDAGVGIFFVIFFNIVTLVFRAVDGPVAAL